MSRDSAQLEARPLYRPLRRIADTLRRRYAAHRFARALDNGLLAHALTRRAPMGYVAAVLGVAVASCFIALADRFVHIENISLVYLLVVIGLAAVYGRGPAILGSILAFLAYDFFFIPPLYFFTVADPTEWLSLFALLATSLVVGHLTSSVQARAEEALASQQEALASQRRTATLFSLAQLIASAADEDALLNSLAARVVSIFAPASVSACAIILPDDTGSPTLRTIAPPVSSLARELTLDIPERAAQAAWVLEHGSPVGGKVRASGAPAPQSAGDDDTRVAYFVPLVSRYAVVGVLGIAGAASIRALLPKLLEQRLPGGHPATEDDAIIVANPLASLFAACCSQIALALDRQALQREAIHAAALRESDRLKDSLLGSVTHDLRTPLASIEAAAGSLLETDIQWSEEERREFLETIATSADRLNRLVGNLLDLSRLEAGVALPEKRWYPFGDVIATVLDRLDLAGRTKGRRIEVDVPDDLPLVQMDHAQIEQVLTNLIENALKYSPPDRPIRVRARIAMPARELEVRVSDEGIGIPPNEIQAIFTKFYRVQHVRLPWASMRPPAGTGLGLAICAAIVEAHGGSIWAESTLGKGSTFIFTLPIPLEQPRGELPEIDFTRDKSTTHTSGVSGTATPPSSTMPAAETAQASGAIA